MNTPRTILFAALSALTLGACSQAAVENMRRDPPPATAKLSRAYKEVVDKHYATNPLQANECAREIHDRYWVYGPDGKVYPGWHPPVDPETGCAFGHEHGMDPSGSRLASIGLPLGYTNEKLFELDSVNFRDEDHVGHKIEWKNDMPIEQDGRVLTRCDLLIKLHQGTHSPDALTNNLHELFYYAKCGNGTSIQWRSLNAFGKPGHVHANCLDAKEKNVNVGAFVPSTSPEGGGNRDIPDANCASGKDFQGRLGENWVIGVGGWGENGKLQFFFGPYFQVHNPSRFFDPATANKIGRPIDLCFKTGSAEAESNACEDVQKLGRTVAWNDPASPWNGADRTVHMNGLRVKNLTGVNKWYTDAFGDQLSRTPDPAKGIVVEQFIGSGDNDPFDRGFRGGNIEGEHDHPSVRAPN